jgi:hypothetical protein
MNESINFVATVPLNESGIIIIMKIIMVIIISKSFSNTKISKISYFVIRQINACKHVLESSPEI